MTIWSRIWQPTPICLSGKFQGQRSRVGCSPWGHKEWLRDFTFSCHFHALEKEMVTHSSVLAWRIPGTVEPGGLPSMGSHRVKHDCNDLAAAADISWCLKAMSTQAFCHKLVWKEFQSRVCQMTFLLVGSIKLMRSFILLPWSFEDLENNVKSWSIREQDLLIWAAALYLLHIIVSRKKLR